MFKRLLPFVATVAMACTPAFAAAYGQPPVHRAHRAPQYAPDVGVRSSHLSMNQIMNRSTAIFSGDQPGYRLSDGRLVMKLDGSLALMYQNNNGSPIYLNTGARTNTGSSKHGDRLIWGFNIDTFMKFNDALEGRFTLVSGNPPRTSVSWDTNEYRHGPFLTLLDTEEASIKLEVNNMYVTYNFGHGIGLLGGFVTSGLTPFTNLRPSEPIPRYSDLLEYTSTTLDMFFSTHGVTADLGILDPGAYYGGGQTSRKTSDSTNRRFRNFQTGIKYEADAGGMQYMVNAKYMYDIMDVTMLSVMNGQTLSAVEGGDPSAFSLSGHLQVMDWSANAYWVRLDKLDASASTNVVASTGDSWVSNPAHLLGFDLGYRITPRDHMNFFMDFNRHKVIAGLYAHQFGVNMKHQLDRHVGLNAMLMHYDSPPNANNVRASNVLLLGMSFGA